MSTRILVVTSGGDAATTLQAQLQDLGHQVCGTVHDRREVCARAAELQPGLVVIDLAPGREEDDGALATQLGNRFAIPVVYLRTAAARGSDVELDLPNLFGFLRYPCGTRQLGLTISLALARHSRERGLQRTIAELRRRRHLGAYCFDCLPDGLMLTGADGRLLLVNQVAARIVRMHNRAGQSTEYGMFRADRETPVARQELLAATAAAGGTIFVRNQDHPNGALLSITAHPLTDSEGATLGRVVMLRDVTRLDEMEAGVRQAATDLQRQNRLLEAVLDSIGDGVIVADRDGKYEIYNRGAWRIQGPPVSSHESDSVSEHYGLYAPDRSTLVPADELALPRALRNEATVNMELYVRNRHRPEGAWVQVSGNPLRDQSGAVRGGVIVFHDVTDDRRNEDTLRRMTDALRAQTRTMEIVFDSISDGVVAADGDGRFTLFNPAAERMVGKGMTNAGTDQWSEEYGIFFVDGETPVPTDELPLVRAIRGESMDDLALFLRNEGVPDGVYISVNGRPLRGALEAVVSEEARGGVITFRDVTERVRTEEALMQAFSQGRMEVLDTILHNIGNAINSVAVGTGTIREELREDHASRGLRALAQAVAAHDDDWISYLQNDPQGRQVRPFVAALAQQFGAKHDRMLRAIERVVERVSHIMDIIRTQRSLSESAPVFKDIDVRQAVMNAVNVVQDSLAQRAIEVQIDCGRKPVTVRIQESRFHQMLVNLVKNAIDAIGELNKRAPAEGGAARPRVRIVARVTGQVLELKVMDNGIGLEPESLRTIFRPGYTTRPERSGLGLHSAANYVIGTGGSIEALSDGIGHGTTIHVKLRVPDPPRSQTATRD